MHIYNAPKNFITLFELFLCGREDDVTLPTFPPKLQKFLAQKKAAVFTGAATAAAAFLNLNSCLELPPFSKLLLCAREAMINYFNAQFLSTACFLPLFFILWSCVNFSSKRENKEIGYFISYFCFLF